MTKPLLRKTSESRLTSRSVKSSQVEAPALDGFPCVVYEADSSLQILRASPNVRGLLGIDPDRIIGAGWLFDEGVVPADRDLLKQTLRGLAPNRSSSLIHRLIDDHGRIITVAHNFERINGGNGHEVIRGSLLPLRFSDGHGASIEVAMVSKYLHKIGNHFQLLNLMLHSIRRSGAILAELEQIEDTTEKAIDLTRSFSDFLQQPTSSTDIHLRELLDSVVHSRRVTCRAKNLDLVIRSDGSLRHAVLTGDSSFLEMAIGAVLDNAIHASPIGGKVWVKSTVLPSVPGGGRTVNVEISDTRSSVTADRPDESNEPFQMNQADGKGMDLGLACRYIEMHGGLLRNRNGDGTGNVVEIALPIALDPDLRVDERLAPSS